MGSETESATQGLPSPFPTGTGHSGWSDGEALPSSSSPHRRHLWAPIQAQRPSSAPYSALHVPAPPWIPHRMGIGDRAASSAPLPAAAQKEPSDKVKIRAVLTSRPQRLPCTILGGRKHPACPPSTCPQRRPPAPLTPSLPTQAQGDKTSPHPQRCLGASVYPSLLLRHMVTPAGKSSVEQWAQVSSQHGAGLEGSLGPAER